VRTNLAYSAYSQNNLSIESSEKLIEMLYEGALKFTSMAKRAINENDIEKRVYWINRSIAIFTELINSLDYSGGDIAHYVSGLYTHQIKLLTQANTENNPEHLDTVINVLKSLLEAWRETTNVNRVMD